MTTSGRVISWNGYSGSDYPAGFDTQDNAQGLKANTRMLMIWTGFNF